MFLLLFELFTLTPPVDGEKVCGLLVVVLVAVDVDDDVIVVVMIVGVVIVVVVVGIETDVGCCVLRTSCCREIGVSLPLVAAVKLVIFGPAGLASLRPPNCCSLFGTTWVAVVCGA